MTPSAAEEQALHETPPQRILLAPRGIERAVYALLKVLAHLPLGVWRGLGVILGWVVY